MRRRPRKEGMRRERDHSYDHRGSSGKYGKIYKPEYLESIKNWIPGKGEHELMLIPFYVGSNTNSDFRRPDGLNRPFTQEQMEDKDTFGYKLTVLVHNNIGVNKDMVLCPRTIGKPCPICEHRDVLDEEGASDEELRKYGTAKKALYNIICFDSEKDFDKWVQVWEAPHQSIEDVLSELAVEVDRRTSEVIDKPYYLPDEGWNVFFEKIGSGLSTEYKQVKILERTKDQDLKASQMDKAFDDAIDFEDAIEVKEYDELYEMIHGTAPEDTGTKASREESSTSRFRGRRESKEVEEKPRSRGRGRGRGRGSEKEEKEEKEESDDDCPGFGKQTNELDECSNCPNDTYDRCYEAMQKNKRGE